MNTLNNFINPPRLFSQRKKSRNVSLITKLMKSRLCNFGDLLKYLVNNKLDYLHEEVAKLLRFILTFDGFKENKTNLKKKFYA